MQVRPIPLLLAEKCNNCTHLPNIPQNILKKSDRLADGVGRADEGSHTNLLPLAKKFKTALNPKSDAAHAKPRTKMR